ncbi:MAG: membrane-bound O-acyltransferase family protein [Bacteroidetes bacterium]|nr:MAG: membrane-bound O-acyltransferase family protein [Bacteroidota bacterium]
MLFNSLHFLLFFPLVCLVYFLLASVKWRAIWLLLASYYFYMNWEPAYALLILTSTLSSYLTAIGMERQVSQTLRRLYLIAGLVVSFSLLFFFKYFNFAGESIEFLLERLGIAMHVPRLTFLLPMGISFYTFQAVGYIIDVYRGKVCVERNLFYYALFVSFFPQLVAGPIERAGNLLSQFREKHPFSYDAFASGFRLMLWGYFMKLVVADRSAMYVDYVYDYAYLYDGLTFSIASLLFSFQIYGDFAGYSLIAIGAARIMGFDLMENFRRPYFATDIVEFWRRWHISLSTWFRDYLYYPLGGNRRGWLRTYVNLLVTFLVSGIWHGANWTFILWGALHGVLEVFNRVFRLRITPGSGVFRFLGVALTFCTVSLAWVFFRSPDIEFSLSFLRKIFTDWREPYMPLELYIPLMSIALLLFKELKDEAGWEIHFLSSKSYPVRMVSSVVLLLIILLFGQLNSSQFIYFQF